MTCITCHTDPAVEHHALCARCLDRLYRALFDPKP